MLTQFFGFANLRAEPCAGNREPLVPAIEAR